jgi:hypothetical protein
MRKTELFKLIAVADDSLSVTPKNSRSKVAAEPVVIPLSRVVRAIIEPQF